MPLLFTNPTLLDLRLLTTFGLSAKPASDEPIGMFGTGLKYAIASALRRGAGLRLTIGPASYTFELRRETIRDQEAPLVYLLPEAGPAQLLPFTADLGPHWEPWMALRELASNAWDEGGEVGEGAELEPQEGMTQIVLDGPEFDEAWGKRKEWLLQEPPTLTAPRLEIHQRPSTAVFYRGIKVASCGAPALFTYNITEQQKLTEDRTLDLGSVRAVILRTVMQDLEDEGLMREFLLAKPGTFEASLDFWFVDHYTPSEAFLSVARELRQSHRALLRQDVKKLLDTKGFREDPPPAKLTEVEEQTLGRAKAFLARHGHHVAAPILCIETLGDQGILGLAAQGKIFLSRAAFGKGTKHLAVTLLEEHLHLTRNLPDESRAMQEFLLEALVSEWEDREGTAL